MYTKIPNHILRQIKDSLSIVDVVGRYVELKRAGNSYKGICPFHKDSAPSFSVSDDRGFFYCFGCSANGDVIKFLELIENLTFPEAVERAAEEAGIEIPRMQEMSPEQKRLLSEKDRLLEVNGIVNEQYQHLLLKHPDRKSAQDYIKKRGISSEMVSRFGIGFAPDGWENLVGFADKKGLNKRLLEKLGLIIPGKRGGHYDRFRNRLMFPIVMQGDKVLGFGGRTLGDDDAKYINSSESPVFSKSHCFYGNQVARLEIARTGSAILVEGNIDVVIMHQFGFVTTLATLGTALTEHHLQYLKRRKIKEFVIVFDGDDAGKKAMFRSLDLILKENVNSRAVLLPDGHDPDSYLREQGEEKMRELIDKAPYLFDLWLKEQYTLRKPGPRGTSDCLRAIVPMLAKMSDPVEKELYLQRIAGELSVPVSMVMQVFRQFVAKRNWEKVDVRQNIPQLPLAINDKRGAEEELFRLLLNSPEIVSSWFIEFDILSKMTQDPLRQLCRRLIEMHQAGEDSDPIELLNELDAIEWKNQTAKIIIQNVPLNEDVVERSFKSCLGVLNIYKIEEEIAAIKEKMKKAINSNDDDVTKSGQRLIELQKQLREEKTKLH